MKDELITFETAKLAKEKGFIGTPTTQYVPMYIQSDDCGEAYAQLSEAQAEDYSRSDFFLAPTQSLLQRWLREAHIRTVEVVYENGWWCYIVKTLPTEKDIKFAASGECQDGDLWLKSDTLNTDWYTAEYKSYEEALEAGLYYALNTL